MCQQIHTSNGYMYVHMLDPVGKAQPFEPFDQMVEPFGKMGNELPFYQMATIW